MTRTTEWARIAVGTPLGSGGLTGRNEDSPPDRAAPPSPARTPAAADTGPRHATRAAPVVHPLALGTDPPAPDGCAYSHSIVLGGLEETS
jgi:hypothetical protein